MIGHRTAVGLSLLCALIFSAFAVQSASAAKAVNTTAFTCVVAGGNDDFMDPHCDAKVTAGTGNYGHVAISPPLTTEITVDNSTTGGTDPAVLEGKAFGAATQITCKKVHGEGTIQNTEHFATKQHTVDGTITIKYTECSVQKPLKCDVKEPLEVFKAKFEGVEGLGPEGKGMGVEVGPNESKNLTQITYINNGAELCALNGKTVNVEGSAISTGIEPAAKHSGATPDFDHARITGEGTLLFGGVAAGFENTGTVRRKGGNPISLTTTT